MRDYLPSFGFRRGCKVKSGHVDVPRLSRLVESSPGAKIYVKIARFPRKVEKQIFLLNLATTLVIVFVDFCVEIGPSKSEPAVSRRHFVEPDDAACTFGIKSGCFMLRILTRKSPNAFNPDGGWFTMRRICFYAASRCGGAFFFTILA